MVPLKFRLSDGQIIEGVRPEPESPVYYSLQDLIRIATGSSDPRQYIKKLRMRDKYIKEHWNSWVVLQPIHDEPGHRHRIMTVTWKSALAILCRLPSRQADDLRQWVYETGKEAIDQINEPDKKLIDLVDTYKAPKNTGEKKEPAGRRPYKAPPKSELF